MSSANSNTNRRFYVYASFRDASRTEQLRVIHKFPTNSLPSCNLMFATHSNTKLSTFEELFCVPLLMFNCSARKFVIFLWVRYRYLPRIAKVQMSVCTDIGFFFGGDCDYLRG